MRTLIVLFTFILLIVTSLSSSELDTTEDFESLLNDMSDIATKKSINVDYMPSVVTVVDAQTFLDAGIQNVGEALGMLPGIQMQLSVLGQPVTTVRGFKNPRSMISDKIKILIDGVSINNEAAGTSGFYLDFPMQLVEKIEVLRGPGSTIYGAGAFYGAVNIITKLGNEKNENQIYLGTGSYDYGTIGASLNTSSGNWKIFTDAYYEQNDKSIDYNNKTTDEAMQNYSLGVKLVNGNFEFLTRYKSSHYGNFYLYKGDVSPNYDDGREDTYLFSQLSYKTSFNDFKLETKINASRRESDVTGYFTTDVAKIAAIFAAVGVNMQESFYVRDHQVEVNLEAEAILTLPEISSNDISIGLGTRKADLTTNDFYSSVENTIVDNMALVLANMGVFYFNNTDEAGYWENPYNTDLFDETTRTIQYAYIQDLISLNKNIDLVLGARVDNYSDIGTNISKRAGLVYRVNDEFVFKLLYGSAFRAPSFYEKYTSGHIYYGHGVKDISPEETDTYEAAIVYIPDFDNKISLNIYYSELLNIIDIDKSSNSYIGYQTMKERLSKGIELEYFFHPKTSHNLYMNATYTDSEYTTVNVPHIDQNMPDISKVMVKAMYIYRPINKLSFGTTWKYSSETTQNKSKTENLKVNQQHIFDETITYIFSNSSQIRLTIKNILNEEMRLPDNGNTGEDGALREGTNFFLNYSYTF
ncbi:MAG: TonB-dependent receptor [Sulfurimonas sp.]|nr:TonB-dependent receptor [Sulfurimonas sp.]